VEPRAGAKGTAGGQSTFRAQDRVDVSPALDRIRKAARLNRKERFTALLHHVDIDNHVDIDLLRQAFFALKRDAAPGADGMTWAAMRAIWSLGSPI
jgi:hypothetical protein